DWRSIMNIKSLLLGSAAALVAVSGAQAADAIVAAEPEPMEYVRVCDAFGTGYFYIPGTETCLKIGGEIRVGVNFRDPDFSSATAGDTGSWNSNVRARLVIEAKNDSELGTIGSYIRIHGFGDNDFGNSSGVVELDQAYITVGGFKVGHFLTYLDDVGTASEGDAFIDDAKFNSISYTYASDAFTIGLGIDDLSPTYLNNNVGVEGYASATLGAATVALWGAYDFEAEEGLVVGEVSAAIGPGTFELYAGYSTGASAYVASAPTIGSIEWTVGAAYAFKATEKLTITPSINYWEGQGGLDAWGAGLLGEYQLAQGLKASATVDYYDADSADDRWSGFVRLTRSF
ncbi:MAG: porin, partial [Rhizobium rhizophilum]|uniref:porin n=1 Tax=Rhizobium rhizophilum TaxID=1850373 RepID=UPI00391B1C22